MRPADCSRADFRQTEIPNFALPNQAGPCTDSVLDWRFRIEAMLVIEIDVVGTQPSFVNGPYTSAVSQKGGKRPEDVIIATKANKCASMASPFFAFIWMPPFGGEIKFTSPEYRYPVEVILNSPEVGLWKFSRGATQQIRRCAFRAGIVGEEQCPRRKNTELQCVATGACQPQHLISNR